MESKHKPRLRARASSLVTCFALLLATGARASTLTNVQTVFLIVMENVSWSAIKGSSAAPYINHTLLPKASYCEQYFSPPGVASSLPDYLWLEGGTNFGISTGPEPADARISDTNHLVTLLRNATVSWRGYFEEITGADCPLSSVGLYAAYHNPFVYFDDVITNTGSCISHLRPYAELAGDLRSNTVARYNFIVPNLCNDMHNGNDLSCASTNRIATGDMWLAAEIPKITNSQAYSDNGAIFITWDESTLPATQAPIGMMVISPLAKGSGYASTNRYTHASTLRTMQEIFGVRPFLAEAAAATSLSDLFRTNVVSPNSRELTSPALSTDGQFRFTLVGLTPGRTNVVEISQNLSEWFPSFTNVAQSTTAGFTDTTGDNVLKRFYRFSELP